MPSEALAKEGRPISVDASLFVTPNDVVRSLLFSTVLMLAATSLNSAQALTTACSDLSRARVLDRLTVEIPGGDEPAFAEAMRRFDGVTDMSRWEGATANAGVFENRTIGYQSPEVSVSIEIDTERDSDIATITVERTCINDALEDWEPYWAAFRAFLERTMPQ